MAKKQTRRSFSINGLLHDRISEEAARDGVTMSHWVAMVIRAELKNRGRPFGVKLDHVSRAVADRIAETKESQACRR